MKTGASKTDQLKIKNMHKDGKSIEDISAILGITKKCIKAFVEPKAKVEVEKEIKETK